jgi:hypothetical protein
MISTFNGIGKIQSKMMDDLSSDDHQSLRPIEMAAEKGGIDSSIQCWELI